MKIGRYSLINVDNEDKGIVTGSWLQDCTGTLQEAIERAKETEKANSYRINVAIVEQIPVGAQWDIIRALRLG